MKSMPTSRLILALALGLSASALCSAADTTPAPSSTPAKVDTSPVPFDLAKAKAAYPLDTCVVSGDPLEGGDMGPPVDYVYKQKGKPDRLVRFCCPDCLEKFQKNPAKYLKMIDDAAAAKAADKPKS